MRRYFYGLVGEDTGMTNKKPNIAMIQRWYDALGSNKYKQGQDQLCNHNGEFCCLGVLLDIECETDWVKTDWGWSIPAVEACGDASVDEGEDEGEDEGSGLISLTITRDAPVWHKLNIPEEPAEYAEMNDDQEFTFDQIRQHLKKKYLDKAERSKK